MKKTLSTRGFTLIELMVVVAIIGILMAAGILAFTNAQQNSRDSKRIADADAIAKMLEQYYQENGQYPNFQGVSSAGTWTSSLGVLLTSYLGGRPMPIDTNNVIPFVYTVRTADRATSGTGTSKFCIAVRLDNTAKGNCTYPGVGEYDCSYGTGNYYCVSSRQ